MHTVVDMIWQLYCIQLLQIVHKQSNLQHCQVCYINRKHRFNMFKVTFYRLKVKYNIAHFRKPQGCIYHCCCRFFFPYRTAIACATCLPRVKLVERYWRRVGFAVIINLASVNNIECRSKHCSIDAWFMFRC